MQEKKQHVPGVFIPDEVWYAEDLKPIDVRILGELRRISPEEDGSILIKARRIAFKSNCDDKTVANRIRRMARRGWLDIVEISEGGSGGFRINLKRAAAAALVFFTLGTSPALHKQNYNGGVRSEPPHDMYYMGRRKKRGRLAKGKKNPDNEAAEKEQFQRDQHEWFLSIKKGAQHPLGQLRPANGTSTAAPGGTP